MADREGEARQARPQGRGRGCSRANGRGSAPRPGLQALTGTRRVAVITGASSGIGAALAARLGDRGWHCVLLARREDRLREVAERSAGEYHVCDVGDRSSVEAVAASVRERHPAVALLVNNAGIPGRRGFLALDPERIEELVRVNYLAGVWCLRAFLPALERVRPSNVVNVVSVAGTVAFPPSGPYSASKHAQLAFSRAVTGELRPRGIRVHTVNPGFVETEGFPQRVMLQNRLLLRTVIQPDDVARHIIRVIERGHGETFVPRWYRLPAIVQALVPGLFARVLPAQRGRPDER